MQGGVGSCGETDPGLRRWVHTLSLVWVGWVRGVVVLREGAGGGER